MLYIAGEGDDDIHVRRAAADMAAGDTGPMCLAQMRPRLDEPHGLASLLALVNDVTYDGLGPAIEFPEIAKYYCDMEEYLTPNERIKFESIMEIDDEKAREYTLQLARPRFSAWDEAIAQVYEDMHLQAPRGVEHKIARNMFIVIDTYSQTSADDAKGTVSRYIKTLRDLQEKAVAQGGTITVLVIDHTTKSGESYMGSLAKEGDSDTMMEVVRHGDDHSLTLKSLKMRGGVNFAPVHLDLTPFTLNGFNDALGRALSTLVVSDGEQAHRVRKATGSNGDTAAALVLTILTESGACNKAELRRAFLAHKSNAGKIADSVSRAFNRAFDRLTSDVLILIDPEDVVTMVSDK